jgi:hypothetical protein
MALYGTAVDEVVAYAGCKCGSATRTNQTTSHVTTKLAAAADKNISDRFSMSLPSEIETLAAIAVARPQKREELKYFANNTDGCNPLRAGPETSMSSSSRLLHQRQCIQRSGLTCRGKDVKVGLTNTFWN